ncbi:hypothetical protein [Nitratireductor soli]|uniref:hypothetical protein n=1 Tax=Nitratireductor soli TaxID=1670619 RepID=UPI00065E90F6|nr:hypothetical protein [Nitratireductor soli]
MMGDPEAAREDAERALELNWLDVKSLQLFAKLSDKETVELILDQFPNEVAARGWIRAAAISAVRTMFEFNRPQRGIDLVSDYCANTTDPAFNAEEADFWIGFGLLLLRRFDEAIVHLERHLDDERFGKSARLHLGECLFEVGRADDALRMIEDAYSDGVFPRAFNLFYFLLRFTGGRMRESWEEYRNRDFSRALARNFGNKYVQHLDEIPRDQSVFMIAEGGPGDELRFATMYPELSSRFSRLTITCEPRLWSILQRNFPSIRFVPTARWRKEMVPSDYATRRGIGDEKLIYTLSKEAAVIAETSDAFCSVCDVLADLRPDYSAFGKTQSYLMARPDLREEWAKKVRLQGVSELPNIALSWRSMLRHVRRDMHYLAVDDLAPLKSLDAVYWLFQTGVEDEEVADLKRLLPNVRLADPLDLKDDFEGMAAFLANMDCVIAPCNTTAELAGALGVPTIMFGRTRGSRWRARESGQDIWHPSVRNAFGEPLGNRAATVEAIVSELRLTLKQPAPAELAAE